MSTEFLHDRDTAAAFYASRLGQVAARMIGQRLAVLWPRVEGMRVLGIGYPAPFLHLWQGQAYGCVNATTSQHRVGPYATRMESTAGGICLVNARRLPFPDLLFDRVLVIHGVEAARHDARLLREIWRILKDDGRIAVVAPNRAGLWAHLDWTPFGQGQPYSRGQVDRLLARALFRAERREPALFAPPSGWGPVLRGAAMWEAVGRAVVPSLAGVMITEAVKDHYAAVPVAARASRRVVVSEPA